jgi:hypothetical protein
MEVEREADDEVEKLRARVRQAVAQMRCAGTFDRTP